MRASSARISHLLVRAPAVDADRCKTCAQLARISHPAWLLGRWGSGPLGFSAAGVLGRWRAAQPPERQAVTGLGSFSSKRSASVTSARTAAPDGRASTAVSEVWVWPATAKWWTSTPAAFNASA